MKKLTAVLLAVLMVSFCFAVSAAAEESAESVDSAESVESVDSAESAESAESSDNTSAPVLTNLVAGKSYTLASDDGTISYQGTCEDAGGQFGLYTTPILTDGNYRKGVDEEDFGTFNRSDAVPGLSVELAGSYRKHTYTFDLGGSYEVSSVVVINARRASNRYLNVVSVEAYVNGAWTAVNFTETDEAAAFCEKYTPDNGVTVYDQFWNITCAFDAVSATQVRVTFDTTDASKEICSTGNGYIIQLDEIEIYGAAPSSSDDSSTEGSGTDSDASSTETSNGKNDNTVTTGDTGIVVFAVLAVVALGGAVVAKKIK